MNTITITKRERNIAIIVLVVLILLLCGLAVYTSNLRADRDTKVDLITNLNQELEVISISDSTKGAQVRVLEDKNTDMILAMNATNSTMKALQDEIKRVEKKIDKGSSVSIISSGSQFNAVDSSKTIVSGISMAVDSILSKYNQYPIYTRLLDSTSFKGWLTGSIKIGHNFSDIRIITRDTVAVTIGYNKRAAGIKNWFKPKEPFAQVHSKNPYSEVTDFMAYRVSLPKPKRFAFVAGGGVLPFAVVQSYDGQRAIVGYGGGFMVGVVVKIAEF